MIGAEVGVGVYFGGSSGGCSDGYSVRYKSDQKVLKIRLK